MSNTKSEKIKRFVKKHKIKFYVFGGIIFAFGMGFFGFKIIPRIKARRVNKVIETGSKVVRTLEKELPFKNIWENLSGEQLTPSKLGDEVRMTAQKINRRLIECGLQERMPNGEYKLTELGAKFGKGKWKVLANGHSFVNIEWDKRVLEVIFTPEELAAISEMNERIAKIVEAWK